MADLPNNTSKPDFIKAINESRNITSISEGLNSSGQRIYRSINSTYQFQQFVGVIKSTGPLGSEANYTDYRYWVELQQNNTSSTTTPTTYKLTDTLNIQNKVTSSTKPSIITAYNLAEYNSVSHGLAVNSTCQLIPIYIDSAQDSNAQIFLRYLIVSSWQNCLVSVTSFIGNGIYQGTRMSGGSTSVSNIALGLTSDVTSYVSIVNSFEYGLSFSNPAISNLPRLLPGMVIGADSVSGLTIVLVSSGITCM